MTTLPRAWRAPELSELRCPCGARLYLDRGAQWCPDCAHAAAQAYYRKEPTR